MVVREAFSPSPKIAVSGSHRSSFSERVSEWYKWICGAFSLENEPLVQQLPIPDVFQYEHKNYETASTSGPAIVHEYIHRHHMLYIFRSMGNCHYHFEAMEGMTTEEMFFYDTHCIMSSAMLIFYGLVRVGAIPRDEVDNIHMTVRVKVALLCCLLVSIKFENDCQDFPAVRILWKIVEPDLQSQPTHVTNEPMIICSFEQHILKSLNVFDVIHTNYHRIAIEHIVNMESEDHLDKQSATRASALSFFFVFNTYNEVQDFAKLYSPHTISMAIVVASLTCLQEADSIPKPRKVRFTKEHLHVASVLLQSLVSKPKDFTLGLIGGIFLEKGTWQYSATRKSNMFNAIYLLN
tara:strand:- start:2099 stop:3148 length:1050 start_codon:yes stop_codon:yes gene_type:complete